MRSTGKLLGGAMSASRSASLAAISRLHRRYIRRSVPACAIRRTAVPSTPPGGWWMIAASGCGGLPQGHARAAAMLSRSTTSPFAFPNGLASRRTGTNSTRASCDAARSAIRRWYRYPPVSCSGEPSVRRETSIRVLHVAPTAFGDDGLFGGGERYPFELAHALAQVDGVQCEFVTFGSVPRMQVVDGLQIRVIRARGHLHRHPGHPFAALPMTSIRLADVVHVHHLYSTSSRLAALLAAAVGTRTVATDHGLVARDRFGLVPRLFDAFLPVSKYAARVMRAPAERTTVVYGGADPYRFRPENEPRAGVLYVGRLTPHKGVDRVIAGLPDGASLTIAGTGGHDPMAPERDYERHLELLARGRNVRFLGAVWDQAVLNELYANALTYQHGHSVGGTNPSLLRAIGAGAATDAFCVSFNRDVLGDAGRYWSTASEIPELVQDAERDLEATLRRGERCRARAATYRWDDVAADYEKLCRRLAARELRLTLRQRGLCRAAQFNWDDTARQIWDVLTTAL